MILERKSCYENGTSDSESELYRWSKRAAAVISRTLSRQSVWRFLLVSVKASPAPVHRRGSHHPARAALRRSLSVGAAWHASPRPRSSLPSLRARALPSDNRNFACAWATIPIIFQNPHLAVNYRYLCFVCLSALTPISVTQCLFEEVARGCVCTNERKRSSVCQPTAEFGCVGVFPCAVLQWK